MKLSIIIPVFNEGKTVGSIIQKVESVSLSIEKEIIVVDDGSSDNTKQALKKLKEKYNFVSLEHQKNKGKGAAIKTGLRKTTGDIILVQDADLEYDPNDYPVLINPFLRNEAEIVYGSRLLRENNYSSRLYLLGGKFLTLVLNLFFGTKLTDVTTGYKVFKKSVLEKINLKEERFAFCEEVTSKLIKKSYRIKEVPVYYKPRRFEDGKKIRWWRDGTQGLYVIIKCKIF
jgi:glycosyltransferase involved in cell wall biosynthesis